MRGSATCELRLRQHPPARRRPAGQHRHGLQDGHAGPRRRAHLHRRHRRRPLRARHDDCPRTTPTRRYTFGKPIAKHQGVQFKFARHERRDTRHGAPHLRHRPHEGRGSKRHTLEAAQTKLFSGTRCTQICLECQQVLGGNGYSKEYHVERFVRDAKLLEIGEGTNEILRMLIGGTVLAQK